MWQVENLPSELGEGELRRGRCCCKLYRSEFLAYTHDKHLKYCRKNYHNYQSLKVMKMDANLLKFILKVSP